MSECALKLQGPSAAKELDEKTLAGVMDGLDREQQTAAATILWPLWKGTPSAMQGTTMQALLVTRAGATEWTTRSLFETDLPRLRQ